MFHLFFLLNLVLITGLGAESSRVFTATEPTQLAKSPIKHSNTISKLSNGNTSEANYTGSAALRDPTDQL